MPKPLLAFVAVSMAGLAAASADTGITIPTVTIANPGNAPDPTTGYGSVGYTYNIATAEVTNAQYAEFLNSVASTDTNNLYAFNMSFSWGGGGITRSGLSGSYTYATIPGYENRPVGFVNYWNATRFANWMHNGQPAGPQDASTTEDGAYTLTPAAIAANSVARNGGAQWAIASEDEWYKAAYHQPASMGGDSDDYWLYGTSSNTITTAQANIASAIGNTTPVGSYAANYYGVYDMAGNLWEWTEGVASGTNRVYRGGAYDLNDYFPRSDVRSDIYPTAEGILGFRMVLVPAPASLGLLALGGLVATSRRRDRARAK